MFKDENHRSGSDTGVHSLYCKVLEFQEHFDYLWRKLHRKDSLKWHLLNSWTILLSDKNYLHLISLLSGLFVFSPSLACRRNFVFKWTSKYSGPFQGTNSILLPSTFVNDTPLCNNTGLGISLKIYSCFTTAESKIPELKLSHKMELK